MNEGRVRILAAFGASMLASIGLTVVYAVGGDPQIEGALLGVALGGIAVGLVLFAHHMLPGDQFVEPRDIVPHATAERPGVEAAFEAGAEPIERRRIIAAAFAASVGLLGIAALFPDPVARQPSRPHLVPNRVAPWPAGRHRRRPPATGRRSGSQQRGHGVSGGPRERRRLPDATDPPPRRRHRPGTAATGR